MNADTLKNRLKNFAVRIIKMADYLPNSVSGKTIAHQIIRSGTSPGANYRAACIAKSDKDFINKLKIVEEELDETIYWLNLISETGLIKPESLNSLQEEAKALLAIITRSIITKRNKLQTK